MYGLLELVRYFFPVVISVWLSLSMGLFISLVCFFFVPSTRSSFLSFAIYLVI